MLSVLRKVEVWEAVAVSSETGKNKKLNNDIPLKIQ